MFSMFGRTDPPQQDRQIFVWIQSGGEINKIDSDEEKMSSVFGGKKMGGIRKGPTFFSEQGPA